MPTVNKITKKSVREGSVIMVAGGFGTEPPQKAVVEGVESDIKNGMPGIEYKIWKTEDRRWAYLDQITEVIKY